MFTYHWYLETLLTCELQEIYAQILTCEQLLAEDGLEISDLENPLREVHLYYWDDKVFYQNLSQMTVNRDVLIDAIVEWVEAFPPNQEDVTEFYLSPYGTFKF
jgi:hypothetical protein